MALCVAVSVLPVAMRASSQGCSSRSRLRRSTSATSSSTGQASPVAFSSPRTKSSLQSRSSSLPTTLGVFCGLTFVTYTSMYLIRLFWYRYAVISSMKSCRSHTWISGRGSASFMSISSFFTGCGSYTVESRHTRSTSFTLPILAAASMYLKCTSGSWLKFTHWPRKKNSPSALLNCSNIWISRSAPIWSTYFAAICTTMFRFWRMLRASRSLRISSEASRLSVPK
mmetsp:Transcript_15618/g.24313  ORF Transcript_15618/g.24313 Transcript_15618/m.24313 type:complete len:226 (-) Transcript_15618:838-1515(-)